MEARASERRLFRISWIWSSVAVFVLYSSNLSSYFLRWSLNWSLLLHLQTQHPHLVVTCALLLGEAAGLALELHIQR